MKRSLTLLAVGIVTAASTGCTCCPCLRNICPWNVCAPSACPPTPVYAAAPACAPACPPAPMYAAQPYAVSQQYTVPQYAQPQFVAAPAQPVFSDAGCGQPCPCPTPCAAPCAAPCATCAPSYVTEMGCGMPYTVGDPGCGYMDSGYAAPQQQQQMMIDPGPAP
jgi:hypothetical protein